MSVFTIREAKKDDVVEIAKVRVDTWRATYKGIVPDDFLQSLSYQEISERWKKTFWENKNPNVEVFVAEDEEQNVVGFATCGPEQSQDPVYRGEIYALYVRPQSQNHGIGRELVRACVRHLTQKLQVDTMLIWALTENPSRRFYESLGGKLVKEKTQEIGGKMLSEVGYGWDEIHRLAV